TYEMDADNLKEIGHKGFTVDAQTMSAILFDFATRADYRAAVKKEFDGIKALFGEYQAALKKVYTVPAVPGTKESVSAHVASAIGRFLQHDRFPPARDDPEADIA